MSLNRTTNCRLTHSDSSGDLFGKPLSGPLSSSGGGYIRIPGEPNSVEEIVVITAPDELAPLRESNRELRRLEIGKGGSDADVVSKIQESVPSEDTRFDIRLVDAITGNDIVGNNCTGVTVLLTSSSANLLRMANRVLLSRMSFGETMQQARSGFGAPTR